MVALLLQVSGLACLALGCFLIAPAVGFIAAGVGIIALGVALERS